MGGLVVGSGFPSFVGESEVGGQGAEPSAGAFRRPKTVDFSRLQGPLTHELLAFFPFKETAGVRIDNVWLGYPQAVNERQLAFPVPINTTIDPRGRRALRAENGGLDFTLGNNILSNKPAAGTVAFWIRLTGPDSVDTYLFAAGATFATDVILFGTDPTGVLKIYFDTPDLPLDLIFTTSAVIGDARWHHVALTADGSTWKIYVDGVAVSLSVIAGSNSGHWIADISGDNVSTYILAQGLSVSAYDMGIADFGIWQRALREEEVRQLYWDPDSIYYRTPQPLLLDRYRMHPPGIASSEAVGIPELAHAIKFTGIASASALGTHELVHVLKMLGIAPGEAVGTPELAHVLKLLGIASSEAVGTPELAHVLKMLGISSAEAVGLPELAHLLKVTGIGSAEAVGLPELAHVLKPGGIASAAALGTPSLALLLKPSGIASAEALGIPELAHVLKLAGIASAEAFGALVLTGPQVFHAIGLLAKARVGEVDLSAVAGGITVALSRSGQLFMIVKVGGLDRESAAGDVSGEGKV